MDLEVLARMAGMKLSDLIAMAEDVDLEVEPGDSGWALRAEPDVARTFEDYVLREVGYDISDEPTERI